jgi:hypothetical protein
LSGTRREDDTERDFYCHIELSHSWFLSLRTHKGRWLGACNHEIFLRKIYGSWVPNGDCSRLCGPRLTWAIFGGRKDCRVCNFSLFLGRFQADLISRFRPSAFVLSEEGSKTQKRVWDELNAKLEKIQPGILSNI